MSAVLESLLNLDKSSVLAGITACLLVTWLLRVTSVGRRYKLPPGPMPLHPPFHYIIKFVSLIKKINAFLVLRKLAETYGDMVYVKEGNRRFLIIASPEAVKETLIQQADVTSGREEFWELVHATKYKGGVIFSEGNEWTEHRRFTLAALRNFGLGKKSLENSINEEARILRDELSKHIGKPLNLFTIITNTVSNIICQITFGRRFEYDDPKFVEMVERIAYFVAEDPDIMSDLPMFVVNERRRNLRNIRDMMKVEVADHKSTLHSSDVRDVIDMYLVEAQQAQKNGGKSEISEDKLWALVFDLFMAGTETTSNTLLWILLFMAGHPDMQEKIANEIKTVIGNDTPPNFEHRKDMPFTEAALIETLRFRPIAPNGVPHKATADIKVRDYDIPAGTVIVPNILYIHHDPKVWGDPEVYRPERFLSEDGKKVIQHEAFMAFGAGRRICLGEQLAKMELFLFFTNILQQFKVSLPPGVKPDYDYGHRMTTLEPKPYQIILEER